MSAGGGVTAGAPWSLTAVSRPSWLGELPAWPWVRGRAGSRAPHLSGGCARLCPGAAGVAASPSPTPPWPSHSFNSPSHCPVPSTLRCFGGTPRKEGLQELPLIRQSIVLGKPQNQGGGRCPRPGAPSGVVVGSGCARADTELPPGGHGGARGLCGQQREARGLCPPRAERGGGVGSADRGARPTRPHSEFSCASRLLGGRSARGCREALGCPRCRRAGSGPGGGSGAATVGRAQRQEDVRLALDGGAAVGKPRAAPQFRGHVLDTRGLGAGGG